MSTTQSLPLYQSNESPDWALVENVDARQLAETHLAAGEPGGALKLSKGTGSLGSGNGAVDVAAGSCAVNGTTYDITAQSVDIPYGDDEPRRDVIYVDGDGTVQVRLGQPGPFVWDSNLASTQQTLKNAYRPAPPDLVSTSGFVLGVVTVEANAASLAAEDVIHDFRIGPPTAIPKGDAVDLGYTLLDADMGEDEVRAGINNGSAGDAFWAAPGAQWTVTNTLTFPDGCTVYGNTPMRGGGSTFIKGFDGPLANVGQYSTFHNVVFDGNKSNGYGGHVVTGGMNRTTRNSVFEQCNFLNATGDGWHTGDMFFMTFRNCLFQRNNGWGIWLGQSENPHNQWLGPCYIADNSAGGVYQQSYGRNQRMFAYVGNNGGPGIQFADPGQTVGFRSFVFMGALVNHDGPGYLVTAGRQDNHRFLDTMFANNASQPASGLTTPVGHIQVEGGTLDASIVGGHAYGLGQLITSAATSTHSITLESLGEVFRGDVEGSNLQFSLFGESGALDGTVNTAEYARYGPDGTDLGSSRITHDANTGTDLIPAEIRTGGRNHIEYYQSSNVSGSGNTIISTNNTLRHASVTVHGETGGNYFSDELLISYDQVTVLGSAERQTPGTRSYAIGGSNASVVVDLSDTKTYDAHTKGSIIVG